MAAPYRVFISCHSQDEPSVRRIVARLTAAGLNFWLDLDELRPGQPWRDGLAEALRAVGAAVVFVGAHGVGSWDHSEVRSCLSRLAENDQPVVVVLLPGAPEEPVLPPVLDQGTWFDFRAGLSEAGQDRIVRELLQGDEEQGSGPALLGEARRPEDQLAAAQRELKERTILGQGTEDVRAQILQLRREIREGVQLQPGDYLGDGRFHLLKVLGRGGFGTVWQAWDEEKHELVAAKVLHGQHAEDRSRRERFFRGARRMAALHHPGIARVLAEHLEWGGHHYFVMEHVGGGDLREAVLAGRLSLDQVVPLVLAVGEALAFAHERGVIHRDVKPANVLLDGGRPKLTDFDLVRVFDSTGGTQTHGHLGTFLYSAPEVLENAKEAGVAADIYSLAMTAVFAFYGSDLPPDVWRWPETFVETLPCSAARRYVLRRGISWEPERRPSSISALCKALRSEDAERSPGEEHRNERDGTVLLFVPGGEYVLGDDDSEELWPAHRVTLSPFWIARHPVTNAQYARFLQETRGVEKPRYWSDERLNDPRQPVVGVSWSEAEAYCAWAGLQLPSEAQWEAAARSADRRRYPWGNDEPTLEHANFDGRHGGPTPVGAFPRGAGPFGALDQAGNVWEWCADCWDPLAYRGREGQHDPLATKGSGALRCLRGGSWLSPCRGLVAADRDHFEAAERNGSIGFRGAARVAL